MTTHEAPHESTPEADTLTSIPQEFPPVMDIAANEPVYSGETDDEAEAAMSALRIKEHIELRERSQLEKQFAESHQFNLGHEDLEYAMIDPDEGHPESGSAEWTVFIGGFSSIKETYKNEMLDLALSGKRVLFIAPDKGIPPTTEDTDYFNARAGALPETIRNKAAAVLLLLLHLGIENANVVGHSQGGAVAAALAGAHSGLVKRLILDNPAGLIGEDSVGSLLHRVAAEAKVENTEGSQTTQMWKKQLQRIMKFPIWRATKEIPGIAHTDIRPILEDIKHLHVQKGAGPEIILINANNDQIFKKEDVEKNLGEHPLEQYIDRWAMYTEKKKSHGKFDRGDGQLFVQVMDEPPKRASIIHQIVTEEAA